MKFPVIILVLSTGFVSVSSQPRTENFVKLLQLSGTWAMQTKKGLLYEEWRKSGETEISGKSYRLNQNDTLVLERVRLKEEGEDIFYIPTVQNQNDRKPVTFKLVAVDGNKFTFENKLHDFPQRIIYNLVTTDSIVARIEGTKNGSSGGSDFYFKRIK